MKLEQKIKDLDTQKENIQIQIEKRNARRKIPCKACGEKHMIKDLEVVQTYYYHEPHGCMEGDYSTYDELQFICPINDERNRIMFGSWNWDIPYEKRGWYDYDPEEQFRRMYKHLFKKVIDEHGKKDFKWHNNEYIAKHLKQYGLYIGEKS